MVFKIIPKTVVNTVPKTEYVIKNAITYSITLLAPKNVSPKMNVVKKLKLLNAAITMHIISRIDILDFILIEFPPLNSLY